MFTWAGHWLLSWARWIQYTVYHPSAAIPIWILSSSLRLGLPGGLLRSDFTTKLLCIIFCPVCPMLLPRHSPSVITLCTYLLKYCPLSLDQRSYHWVYRPSLRLEVISILLVTQPANQPDTQSVTYSNSKSASEPGPRFSATAVETTSRIFSWNGELWASPVVVYNT